MIIIVTFFFTGKFVEVLFMRKAVIIDISLEGQSIKIHPQQKWW